MKIKKIKRKQALKKQKNTLQDIALRIAPINNKIPLLNNGTYSYRKITVKNTS